MDNSSNASAGENGIARLKADVGELQRRCSLADQVSDQLEERIVELRSMFVDTNKDVNELKLIMHTSDDDFETFSDDSNVIVSEIGSARAKGLIAQSKRLRSLGSSDSDNEQDGGEEGDISNRICPLEDVVNMLSYEICDLKTKNLKALDEIETLKASSMDDDISLKMNMEISVGILEEKLRKIEAQIRELESRKTGNRSMKNVDLPELKCDALINHKFLQGKGTVLIHEKLRLDKPFVQGFLLGLGIGLLLLFLCIMFAGIGSQNAAAEKVSTVQVPKLDVSEIGDKVQQVLADFESRIGSRLEETLTTLRPAPETNVLERRKYFELSKFEKDFSKAIEEIQNWVSLKAQVLQASMGELQLKLNNRLLNNIFG